MEVDLLHKKCVDSCSEKSLASTGANKNSLQSHGKKAELRDNFIFSLKMFCVPILPVYLE